jgi:hypothetical protein
MKIAVVSDTHNNWANFKKAIEWIKNEKIQLILHCGDISSQETIDDANKLFTGDIKFVKGNADYDLPELPDSLEMEIGDPPSQNASARRRKIAFVHFPSEAKKMAQSGNFDLVFYGHTHKPWDEKVGNCHMINPGELAGQFYKPTFAIYDTVTSLLELKILEKL